VDGGSATRPELVINTLPALEFHKVGDKEAQDDIRITGELLTAGFGLSKKPMRMCWCEIEMIVDAVRKKQLGRLYQSETTWRK
jgi:hypothetical protein